MSSITKCAALLLLVPILYGEAFAQSPCPQGTSLSVSSTVTFDNVFTGTYRTGEPFNVLTTVPGEKYLETFEDMGIFIEVCVTCDSLPLVGLAASEVILTNDSLCICEGENTADRATDASGCTTFTGPIAAGGCASSLDLYVGGNYIETLPIQINSPDAETYPEPCWVDRHDIDWVIRLFVRPVPYNICWDWNEDGSIDASELAWIAWTVGQICNTPSTGQVERSK